MHKFFAIAIGGGLGSLARYFVGAAVAQRMGTRFYYGTFVVNLTACLLLGFSLTLFERRAQMNPSFIFFFPIGFVGAYSTFSTFEWETFSALQTGGFVLASLYVAFSVLAGLMALWLGVVLARVIA